MLQLKKMILTLKMQTVIQPMQAWTTLENKLIKRKKQTDFLKCKPTAFLLYQLIGSNDKLISSKLLIAH